MKFKAIAHVIVFLAAASVVNAADVNVPQSTRQRFPSEVNLILSSESMSDSERQYWVNLLPKMTNAQVGELRRILENERKQLDEIDRRYQGATSSNKRLPAGWITSKEGARLWNPNPQPNETCTWTGSKDADGYATGKGLIIWYTDGKVTQASQGTYSRGRNIATSITLYASGNAAAWSTSGKEESEIKGSRPIRPAVTYPDCQFGS